MRGVSTRGESLQCNTCDNINPMTLFKNKYRVDSTRLPEWDYGQAGYYFVTICTKDWVNNFGEVDAGDMQLSPIGEIVAQEWGKTEIIRSNVILDESTRLTDLVNKFLDLSRLESGRTEIRMNPFDLRQIVDKILETYKYQAENKRIKVITDIPDTLPLALGDPDMIEQVILNLYSNAIKYSPERSKVGIEAKIEQKELVVSVIDNGYGIPKESLPYIFDKFYRVVDVEIETEVEGSGLGLALAREIVERHGGKMIVNSRLGVGSVFSFTIPIIDERDA